MTEAITETIIEEIRHMHKDVEYIKENMVGVDSVLTREEEQRLEESLAEFREGRTTSLESLKKELGK